MKRSALLLAILLFAVSAAFIAYRVISLGYPLIPTAGIRVWQFSFEALLKPGKKQTIVRVGLPHTHGNLTVSEERIASGNLNFNLVREDANQVGIWSGHPGPSGEVISYRATILVRPARSGVFKPLSPAPYPPSFTESDRALAGRLAARWSKLGPEERVRAISATASGDWGAAPPPKEDLDGWNRLTASRGRIAAILGLFSAAGLGAREVSGLLLSEGVTKEPLRWIEAWTSEGRLFVNPETGTVYDRPFSFLSLDTGGAIPLSTSGGGGNPEVRFSLSQQVTSQWRVFFDRIRKPDRFLNRLSLFSLPPEFQATFRVLLLVPIGALMVCVLRNIIGFPTFGIFMPVLMALAFRSTGLGYGLGIFGAIILVGYVIRLALDKLHLLLVPRLSVILTVVIGLLTFLAVAGNKLGMRQFMAVGLLPFVILTMMIERFFVIIEEAGIREGLRNAAGSAAVAAITYQIIDIENLQLTFFIYPELLLVLAGIQILIGRYTGYRLSELIRFRALRDGR